MDRSDTHLVFRDIPLFLWLFGLIFAGLGSWIVFEGGRAPAMGLVLAAIGLGALLLTSALTITADRIRRTLSLEYRSALRHTLIQIPFDDILGINVERSISHNKGGVSHTYKVVLKRKNGEVVPFRSFSSSGSKKKERIASQLREFIGVQGFDDRPAWLVDAAKQPRETGGVHWQIQLMASPSGARWHSSDFKTPGFFLFLAQKAEGQASKGFLASLGSMFFKTALSAHGFGPDDVPGVDQSGILAPLDPALEPHFMAFTDNPDAAPALLNSRAAAPLAQWAARHPLKQFQKASSSIQLVVLFGPKGVCAATLNLSQPEQLNELIALGTELANAQNRGQRAEGRGLRAERQANAPQ